MGSMADAYVLGLLAILALAEGRVLSQGYEPAIVEDIRGASSRIVAGWEASEAQIPHQVNIRMVNSVGVVFSCGGSIIHHEWVITAAHCLANRITFVVRAGVTNLTRPEFIVESDRKYLHPNYNEVSAGVQTDDIALLGLNNFIPYGPTVQPCRLQNTESKNKNYAGVVLTASGFGLTDDPWNGGQSVEVLRWVYLRGISNAACKTWYPGSAVIQDETICTSYYNDTAQSVCQGDSGGPLTALDVDGKPTMVGVASFVSNAGCNSPFPSGFVRPGHYHGWYEEVTNLNFDWSNSDLEPESSENGESESSESDETSEASSEDDETSEASSEDDETSEASSEDDETSEASPEDDETLEESSEGDDVTEEPEEQGIVEEPNNFYDPSLISIVKS